MRVTGLDHASLLVSDLDRSRSFYAHGLGMEEIPRPPSFRFPGAWFRNGSGELHLIEATRPGRTAQVSPGYDREEQSSGFGSHLGFVVGDLDEAEADLRSAGIEIVGPQQERGDGVRRIYVVDPDGYIVELMTAPATDGG